jgi:hypothetical protein
VITLGAVSAISFCYQAGATLETKGQRSSTSSGNLASTEVLYQHDVAGNPALRVENLSAVRRHGDTVFIDGYFAQRGNLFHLPGRKVEEIDSDSVSRSRIDKVDPVVYDRPIAKSSELNESKT